MKNIDWAFWFGFFMVILVVSVPIYLGYSLSKPIDPTKPKVVERNVEIELQTVRGNVVTLSCPMYKNIRVSGGHGRECYIIDIKEDVDERG